MSELTRAQQITSWIVAAVVGLGLAAILHAGWLASVGLVAAVGIAIGLGLAASQRAKQGSDRKPD
jgi:membrane protease YdiL (CAAX protease family)